MDAPVDAHGMRHERPIRHGGEGDTRGVPECEPDLNVEPPPWLVEGARVVHTNFGPGLVGRVAPYKDVPTVWIEFDSGDTKALALEFGLEHLGTGVDLSSRIVGHIPTFAVPLTRAPV